MAPWWIRAPRSASRTARALAGKPIPSTGPVRYRQVVREDGIIVAEPIGEPDPVAVPVLRFIWRHRRTLAPVPPAVVVAILSGIDVGWAETGAIALVYLVATCVAWSLWIGGRDRTRLTVWGIFLNVLAYVVWWLGSLPPAGLPALVLIGAAGWAWRFRYREPVEYVEDDPDEPWQVTRWDDHIGGGPRPLLEGSYIDSVGPLYPTIDPLDPEAEPDAEAGTELVVAEPIGWKAGIVMVPGAHELSSLRAIIGKIGSVYGVPKDSITVEDAGDESMGTLIVTTRRYLAAVHQWIGPRLLPDGRVLMQILSDGTPGYWQAWLKGQGVRHGWLNGAIGSGKSGACDCLLGSLMSEGTVLLLLADLKPGGASLPHWRTRAYRHASTPEDTIRLLQLAEQIMDDRYVDMSARPAVDPVTGEPIVIDGVPQYGVSCTDPSHEWPIVLVFVEEWPQLLHYPEAIRIAAKLLNLGRAACVAFYMTSQSANLSALFGDNAIMRTNLQAGNVMCLWTDSGSGALALGSRRLDVGMIPMGQPGTGFLASAAQPRDLLGRVPYLANPWDAVRAARPAEPGPLILASTMAHAERVNADAARAGALFDAVIAPALAAAPDVVWGDAPQAPEADGLTARQRQVLDHLRVHPEATTEQLRTLLGGMLDQTFRKVIDPLANRGLVHKPGHGRWAFGPAPADSTTSTDTPPTARRRLEIVK